MHVSISGVNCHVDIMILTLVLVIVVHVVANCCQLCYRHLLLLLLIVFKTF